MPSPAQSEKLQTLLAEARAKLAKMQAEKIGKPIITNLNELTDEHVEEQKIEIYEHEIQRFEGEGGRNSRSSEAPANAIPGLPTNKQEQSSNLVWNFEQSEAISRAGKGESFCLIGKAGTGKTTVVREIIKRLVAGGILGPLQVGTKFLKQGTPGVAIVSFTNRAVSNLAKGMPRDLQGNCVTIHKLLEFQPEKYEVRDAEGNWITKMRFAPARDKYNPLPSSLRCIIFEESSMISTELYAQLIDALPHRVQMIFLGDLQQLPPVYGSAILGFKLLELETVELTQIYRQAADSPIISLAWDIASGKELVTKEVLKLGPNGEVTIRPWKKKIESDDALHIISKLFNQLIDAKEYDPETDMVMIPFNRKFGTDEFNKNIAQYLGVKRGAEVFEIIAGFQKHYYAVGDKVLVQKQEAIVEEIVINGRFVSSVVPLSPSKSLNRWGAYNLEQEGHVEDPEEDPQKAMEDVENFLALTLSSQNSSEDEVKQQASHIMKCRIIGSDEVLEISTAGEFSATTFSYALTVHKCQGSEWRKCFLILHHSHAVMLSRELLYTAVTRARESLYILCESDSLAKGTRTQRIRGNTIREKAEYFKGKMDDFVKGGR